MIEARWGITAGKDEEAVKHEGFKNNGRGRERGGKDDKPSREEGGQGNNNAAVTTARIRNEQN